MAGYWVSVLAWNDGAERSIDVMGLYDSRDAAFAAVQARLIDETGFVVGMDDPAPERGTVKDSNVTWDWAVAPVRL